MNNTRNALLAAITLGLAASPSIAADADPASIAQAEIIRFEQALVRGDIDAVMQAYGSDAVLMPPTDETLTYPAAIRAFWQAEVDGLRDLDVEWVRCEQSGDTIYSAGVWSAQRFVDNQAKFTGGNVVTVFTRQADGSWKTTLQTWN